MTQEDERTIDEAARGRFVWTDGQVTTTPAKRKMPPVEEIKRRIEEKRKLRD